MCTTYSKQVKTKTLVFRHPYYWVGASLFRITILGRKPPLRSHPELPHLLSVMVCTSLSALIRNTRAHRPQGPPSYYTYVSMQQDPIHKLPNPFSPFLYTNATGYNKRNVKWAGFGNRNCKTLRVLFEWILKDWELVKTFTSLFSAWVKREQ